jgi:plasmid stabilization system protein ParE
MFKVIFGKKARQDLQEISSYHRKVASLQVANKVRKGIIDYAKKLQTFPHNPSILHAAKFCALGCGNSFRRLGGLYRHAQNLAACSILFALLIA